MAVAQGELLFSAGGEALLRHGVLRKRTAPWEEVLENHTRGSVAVGRGRDGVLRSHADGVPVMEWLDLDGDGVLDTPSVLLQASRTNELTRSEELDHADWTKTNTSITADQATGPDGASSLDEIVEDDTAAGSSHTVRQTLTLTADATYALSFFAKANTRSWALLSLYESGASTNFARAWFNVSDGTVGTTGAGGTGSFTRAYVEDWTDVEAGLYRLVVVGSVGNAATSIIGQLLVADADNSTQHDGDGTSSLYAGYAQLEDGAEFASSYIKTTTAAVPRSADEHWHDFLVPPQEMTVYVKFVERGTIKDGTNFGRLFVVGGDTQPLFDVFSDSNGQYRIAHRDGTTKSIVTLVSPTIDLLQTGEIRAVLQADGDVTLGMSVDGGAEGTVEASGATLQASWGEQRLYLNSGGSSNTGHNAFIAVKVAKGTKTMADMRAAA